MTMAPEDERVARLLGQTAKHSGSHMVLQVFEKKPESDEDVLFSGSLMIQTGMLAISDLYAITCTAIDTVAVTVERTIEGEAAQQLVADLRAAIEMLKDAGHLDGGTMSVTKVRHEPDN